MATRWHYRRCEAELGPVGFSELVNLVRAEQLAADDLVREEWNPEWRPAALAIGLFHMAGRDDLMQRWEAEQAERRRQAVAEAAAAEEEPAWQRRLREVEAERAALEAVEREARAAELAANATRTEIDETLAAALEELDDRERVLQPTRFQRLWRVFAGRDAARFLVRWGPTLAIPNLVAWWLLDWSHMEAQRYPSPDRLPSSVRQFPVVGDCDATMYAFLIFDAMLLSAAAAYIVMRAIERHAED